MLLMNVVQMHDLQNCLYRVAQAKGAEFSKLNASQRRTIPSLSSCPTASLADDFTESTHEALRFCRLTVEREL